MFKAKDYDFNENHIAYKLGENPELIYFKLNYKNKQPLPNVGDLIGDGRFKVTGIQFDQVLNSNGAVLRTSRVGGKISVEPTSRFFDFPLTNLSKNKRNFTKMETEENENKETTKKIQKEDEDSTEEEDDEDSVEEEEEEDEDDEEDDDEDDDEDEDEDDEEDEE